MPTSSMSVVRKTFWQEVRRARRRLLLAAEVGLERLHPRGGEQHRRVVRRAAPAMPRARAGGRAPRRTTGTARGSRPPSSAWSLGAATRAKPPPVIAAAKPARRSVRFRGQKVCIRRAAASVAPAFCRRLASDARRRATRRRGARRVATEQMAPRERVVARLSAALFPRGRVAIAVLVPNERDAGLAAGGRPGRRLRLLSDACASSSAASTAPPSSSSSSRCSPSRPLPFVPLLVGARRQLLGVLPDVSCAATGTASAGSRRSPTAGSASRRCSCSRRSRPGRRPRRPRRLPARRSAPSSAATSPGRSVRDAARSTAPDAARSRRDVARQHPASTRSSPRSPSWSPSPPSTSRSPCSAIAPLAWLLTAFSRDRERALGERRSSCTAPTAAR